MTEPSALLAALDLLRPEDLRFVSEPGRTIVAGAGDEIVGLLRRTFPHAQVDRREGLGDAVLADALCIAPEDSASIPDGYVRLEDLSDGLTLYASGGYLLGEDESAVEVIAAERRRGRDLQRELAAERRLRAEHADAAQRLRDLAASSPPPPSPASGNTDNTELRRLRAQLAELEQRHTALVGSRTWRYTRRVAALAGRLGRRRA